MCLSSLQACGGYILAQKGVQQVAREVSHRMYCSRRLRELRVHHINLLAGCESFASTQKPSRRLKALSSFGFKNHRWVLFYSYDL